uniref:Beta-glucosidase 17-like n=1 Tax=Rhizophora mucronata TaxID=61149 RepID=A0A2P2ILH3_RHIMU
MPSNRSGKHTIQFQCKCLTNEYGLIWQRRSGHQGLLCMVISR